MAVLPKKNFQLSILDDFGHEIPITPMEMELTNPAGLTIQDVIRGSKLSSPSDVATFHALRKAAFDLALNVYEDRAGSYNVDHEPTEEMVFGCVSLASEIHKRSVRMTGLLTPLRGLEPLKKSDLSRLLDTTIDLINYASWQYALLKIAFGDAAGVVEDLDVGEAK